MEDISNPLLKIVFKIENYFQAFTICIIEDMVYLKKPHFSNDSMFFVCRNFLQASKTFKIQDYVKILPQNVGT